jgi:antitoxin HigA-1
MHNPPHHGLVLPRMSGRFGRDHRSGKAGISAMGIRLAAALDTTPELWMNMQSQYDLWRARQGRQPVVRRFVHSDVG